jgi:YesN/AraC family two-component response regulator
MYLKNFTVLYVEDSKVLQAYMRNLLKDLVKEIYIANDGKEGITMVSRYKPDIIVSDINMPDIDGLQMSKIIKISYDTPIILLTGFERIENLKKAIEIGINSFVLKPVANEEIIGKLEDIAKSLQDKIDYEKLKNLENQKEKIQLLLNLLSDIGHHWRQPLSTIGALASAYEIKYEMDLLDPKEELENMRTISSQSEKLSRILEQIQKIDFENTDSDKLKELVALSSNPLFK